MSSLQDLKNAVAQTASEKYEVLQERDKLVRAALGLHMKKQTELSEAKVLRGSCADMCPEMERYVREERRQLGVYEMIPDSEMVGRNPLVDHKLAVKEYSRSSADQDLPLPHELRPGPVLIRTMHYLLNNIADKGGDGAWGDWFDFLWNRTRGVRKDITQQQLCDLTAVDLVEKCARFHIYCGERLCEEDMMVFDEKINNENLTKCLQTLKELYEDLETKQIVCPNEAEFRAYMVLMNLNSGDILREVQQLKEDLRKYDVIGFVVKVYSALNSNNYLRFFKLLKRGNFLNACIMHRYFYQVRLKAIHILMRAYNRKENCPAQELVRVLGFENEGEALQFCQFHGLQTDGNSVILDRTYFVEPETVYPKMRAKLTIESKQMKSIGETINGEALPPNIIPEPEQNSFDANGRYIATDLDNLRVLADSTKPVQSGEERDTVVRSRTPVLRRPSPVPGPVPQVLFGRPSGDNEQHTEQQRRASPLAKESTKADISNEIVKDIAKGLFLDVIKEFVDQMSNQLITAVHMYLNYDKPVTADLIQSGVQDQIRSLSEEVLLECQSDAVEKQARVRAQYSLRKKRAEETLAQVICDETVNEQLQSIAQNQCRVNTLELKHQSLERCRNQEMKQLLHEVLREQISDVCQEVYETDVVDKLDELERNKHAVELLRSAKCFKRWRNKYAAQVRLKKAMLTFPPTPSFMNATEQFEHLVPRSLGLNSHGVHLGNKRARVTSQSPLQLVHQRHRLEQNMVLRHYWREKRREQAYSPLDVALVIHQQLRHGHKTHSRSNLLNADSKVHYKMLVCLQGDTASSSVFNDWLTSKLSKGAVPLSAIPEKARYLSMYSSRIEEQCLGICINAIEGQLADKQLKQLAASRFLNSVNGILFVLPTQLSKSRTFWCNEKQRLLALLQHVQNDDKASLAILCPDTAADSSHIEQALDLRTLQDEQRVSSYSVHVLPTSCQQPGATKTLNVAVRRLVTELHDHYVIDSLPMTQYVEHSLHKHLFTAVFEFQTQNSTELSVLDLVDVYNSLIEYVITVAYNQQLNMSEAVCKHNASVIEWLRSTVDDLLLPMPQELDDEKPSQQVWSYIERVTSSAANTAVLYNSVSHIMDQWRKRMEWAVFEEETLLPWTSIILECVQYKLSQLSLDIARVLQEERMDEFVLHFRRKTLHKFAPPHFMADSAGTETTKTPISKAKHQLKMADQSPDISVCLTRSPANESQLDSCISTQDNNNADFTRQPSTLEKEYDGLSGEFDWEAAREKSRNEQFEKYLRSMLEVGATM